MMQEAPLYEYTDNQTRANQIVFIDSTRFTPAEERFKSVVVDQVQRGIHPTPTSINRALEAMGVQRWRQMNVLNGQETRWLRSIAGRKRKEGGGYGRAHSDYPLCDLACCGGDKIPWLVKAPDRDFLKRLSDAQKALEPFYGRIHVEPEEEKGGFLRRLVGFFR